MLHHRTLTKWIWAPSIPGACGPGGTTGLHVAWYALIAHTVTLCSSLSPEKKL